MKGEWCYWNQYFSKEKCELILREGLKIPAKDAGLGVAGMTESTNNEVRRSKTRFIQKTDTQFEWLFDDLWKLAMRCNHDFFNFHVTNLSYIQLAEYDEAYQGEYKMHQDVFWINNDQYHRKLTCVVQLTDPSEYEGGDFQMFGLTHPPAAEQLAEMKNLGSAILIPSFINHAAAPVTKGRRYSLAIWFEGPKWV
jgi:PKHD-type hydroxylase